MIQIEYICNYLEDICGCYNMERRQYTTISFESLKKESWLETISHVRASYEIGKYRKQIILTFNSSLNADNLEPFHFVTLACLIQFFVINNHNVYLNSKNDSIP